MSLGRELLLVTDSMARLTAVHMLFQPLSTQNRKCQQGELWLQNTFGLGTSGSAVHVAA